MDISYFIRFAPRRAPTPPEAHDAMGEERDRELERLRCLSSEPDLMRLVFERRHPVRAFFANHPSLSHWLFLAALAAATIATTIASLSSSSA